MRLAGEWTESVFHVLAHVDVRVPASCHWPPWIAVAREKWGDSSERALGEDAATLARTVTTHEDLARLHAVATLFDSRDQAERASARDLAELSADDVADVGALATARRASPAAEVLRAAAELELPNVATLARADVDVDLARVAAIVPELAAFELRAVRPLGVRGRVTGKTIFVGVADEDHMALQAAHEAIVASLPASLGYVALERRAIGILRRRARDGGLGDAHARWLACFDLSALGPIPDVADGTE